MTEVRQELSPLVLAASEGNLPEWACAGAERREHIARVAELMGRWAEAMGLNARDRTRWQAAGWLHDSLRDADPAEIRHLLPDSLQDVPDSIVHGPAAATRIVGDADDDIVQAVRYHTLGHPDLATIGRALYLADFLEPGRKQDPEWRASLRERVPDDMDGVLRQVIADRLRFQIDRRRPIRAESAAFWNQVVSGG